MQKQETQPGRVQRPSWLKVKAPIGNNFSKVKSLLSEYKLNTVCEEAHCPNMAECWNCGTATFIVLGDVCSRNCRFCAVGSGKPQAPNPEEPLNVAKSIQLMKLRHSVITSVTRDDLPDGGAAFWAEIVQNIRELNPDTTIEILIPDFQGIKEQYQIVFASRPDILNHNIETVPRIYPTVRPKANYANSLKLLKDAKSDGLKTKSGLMVGLGETNEEIIEVLKDLRNNNVDIVTIGQYLQPSSQHLNVDRYVTPDEFNEFYRIGIELGFEFVESAPLVRSSYHAERTV